MGRTTGQNRLHYYGVSEAEFAAIVERQGGGCAICGSTGKLHLDHCHETQMVRGVLCRECNIGLGHFGDDVDLLVKAAAYLSQPSMVPVQSRIGVGRARGERIATAKLTVEDVLAIRVDSRGAKRLAKQYGVHHSTIWQIRQRRTWQHV